MKKSQQPLVVFTDNNAEFAAQKKICEEELKIARAIQAAMVPTRLPTMLGLECAALYLPSKNVGGDLYDVIQVSDDCIAITIFDVASTGVPAALISALAKVSFANHIRLVNSPRQIMERVNEEMVRNVGANFFITAIIAFLDLHDNKLTYCNAAHPYPLVYRKGTDSLEAIESTGTCVGIFENNLFEEKSIYLNSGDWLLFFTDGMYRLFSLEDELLGRKQLEEKLLVGAGKGSPLEFIKEIKKKYDHHEPHGVPDDITVLGIEFLTESRKNQIKVKLGFTETDPVYLQFISYFEEMDKAASIILTAMDNYGYADERIRKMKIILTELFANAVYHGNESDHTKKVTVGHLIDKHKITISIMDDGEGFDPRSVPDPTLPENLTKDCGRGLYIVTNYADSVSFNEKGNRITITKNHGNK